MPRMLNSGLSAHRPRRFRREKSPQAPQVSAQVVAPTEGEVISVPEDLTTIKDLLEWIGEDSDRASAALDQELAKPENHQRKTLVSQLTELILEG